MNNFQIVKVFISPSISGVISGVKCSTDSSSVAAEGIKMNSVYQLPRLIDPHLGCGWGAAQQPKQEKLLTRCWNKSVKIYTLLQITSSPQYQILQNVVKMAKIKNNLDFCFVNNLLHRFFKNIVTAIHVS
jgi:hypothetical protein